VRTILSIAPTIEEKWRVWWENMLLIALFDRANLMYKDASETTNFGSQTMVLLKIVQGHFGPRMFVAVLGALMGEFDSFKYAAEWITTTKSLIKWPLALEMFADEEWDRWPFLR
jgi:hypothetical protein